MFKKFKSTDIHGQTQAKSSVVRNFKLKISEEMPVFSSIIDDLIPKKTPLMIIKALDNIVLYQIDDKILFYQYFNGFYIPTLKLLQQYPSALKKVQVDKGAIKYVLKGADIMCPGLTSAGGFLQPNLQKDDVVAVFAEGMEHPLAIGIMVMSTDEILTKNSDTAVMLSSYINDDLWKMLK